jgi:CRP/FNR family transcriptional regulator
VPDKEIERSVQRLSRVQYETTAARNRGKQWQWRLDAAAAAGEALMNAPSTGFSISHLKVACSNCNLRELCLPLGLALPDIEKLEELVATRRKVKRGEALFRAGDRFESLYAVRLGFLKSTVMSSDGREQVTGFHMAGELVGMDGISAEQHSCDTVALEDTEVCVIPYERLEDVASSVPVLRNHFHKVMSREIVREHGVMLLLGSMHAEERLAAFLLNLSQRFEARGYSRTEFVLRMTRAEIGSFLGLKLETVSRVLSRFAQDGLLEVNQKHVRILNTEGLRAIVSGHGTASNNS